MLNDISELSATAQATAGRFPASDFTLKSAWSIKLPSTEEGKNELGLNIVMQGSILICCPPLYRSPC